MSLMGLVLGRGADVDSRDEDGFSPLHCAKSAEMVRLLVKEGGAEVNVTHCTGSSPLAHDFRNVEVMEALLDEGALVKYGDVSPLVYAVFCNHPEALKVLLSRRGFVRVIEWKCPFYQQAAREVAVSKGRDEMVALLDAALVLAKVCCVSLRPPSLSLSLFVMICMIGYIPLIRVSD